MILREDSSSQFTDRQKRVLLPFFYNNYLHCNTFYQIGILLLIITEVALLQSFFFFLIYSLFLRETRYHALTFLDQHRGF